MSDGRVFNGRQALGLKLVDELGGERDAIAWLEREKGVAKDLPVRDWEPRGDSGLFASSPGPPSAPISSVSSDVAMRLRRHRPSRRRSAA